jgi:hypothetical protein
MKKLTFIEALKVNEERIVYRKINDGNVKYLPNEMKFSVTSLQLLYLSEYYTEPEKFEFECVWTTFIDQDRNERGAPVVFFSESDRLVALKGKKTKVTIEALDE